MTRSRSIAIIAVVVALVAVGAYVAWDQVLRGDSVGALTLPSAAPSSGSNRSSGSGASASPGASSRTDAIPAASFDGTLAGTWDVTSGSQAGYRVREQLANLPAESDAVGRTSDVTGSITITTSGSTSTVSAGTLTVNTTTIASDRSMRDNRLRNEGLQTDQYPSATFKLTAPVEIPAAAVSGTASDLTLTGDLTLHGVTKPVSIPAKAQLTDGTVQVAGSLAFPLSDYSITPPSVGGFVLSVADNGTLEFLVVFAKA
jgi:polyisoprenoid-binding protein YceI